MRAQLLAAILGIVLMSGLDICEASEKVRCEVLTIEASNAGQGIDPALQAHAAILRKAPFSMFDTFKLVHKQPYTMIKGTPISLTLPKSLGGTLQFNNEVKGRLTLTLSIKRPNAGPIIINGKATPGSPFFAAGFKSAHGRWILGITCNKADELIHH